MPREAITIERLPLNEPGHKPDARHELKVEVYYNKDARPRGIYLNVQPVTVDGMFEGFILFTNARALLEETPRHNARRLQEWAHAVKADPRYQATISKVLTDQKLSLAA